MDRKTVLITGGAQGSGRSFALYFADRGFDIILADRQATDSPAYREVIGQLEAKGGAVLARQCDVASTQAVEGLFHAAWEQFKRLDVVIANAGLVTLGETWNLTDAQVNATLAVNLAGTWRTNKYAARCMLRQGSGKIINIASIAALVGVYYHAAYCMSKWGIIGLTKTLAKELQGRNISVNAVCPTPVKTPLSETKEFIAYMNRVMGTRFANAEEMYADPRTRFLEPETVARMCYWLATSEEAATLTGQEIPMDLYGLTL
ncbi:MAG: SDR family oxidoreductase [Desulfovibrio sp.]|jgi:NAD(P)-dependent dehydrogenase (short-subunit alcohol dehydrogenase family)|nr:SDR family oxidoreductase [Desulfovibrio sp.]